MILVVFNLSAPLLTMLLVLYVALIGYTVFFITRSEEPKVIKVLLVAIMVMVPLAPVLYLIFNSPTKPTKNA